MKKWLYKMYINLLGAIAHLPFKALYFISDCMSFVVHYIIRYRLSLVRRHLLLVFPDMTIKERLTIEKGFYHHLCDIIVETIKLLHITDAELKEHINVKNVQLVDDIALQKRPVILLLGHFGNWEWVQEILYRFKVMRIGGEIYKPLRDPVFNDVMHHIRQRFSRNLLISQNDAARTLIRLRQNDEPFCIGFISDQRPDRHHLRYWTKFLGQDTPFIVGGEHIGQKIGAEILYMDIEKPSRGHYILTFRPIQPQSQAPDYPYTRSFLKMMETSIRRSPELWLWTHNRWKHKRNDSSIS
ncbi:MAG: lysophospholipid acyltransferase family protein [Bacteroidaceae bacterium]|nr:lysophospholipid acyltransferase family protein [Bacteroidaceae bacterium]MBQ9192014.1 lysophospholipid acyltransferase family protein [Bacteroidaceae bacterium]